MRASLHGPYLQALGVMRWRLRRAPAAGPAPEAIARSPATGAWPLWRGSSAAAVQVLLPAEPSADEIALLERVLMALGQSPEVPGCWLAGEGGVPDSLGQARAVLAFGVPLPAASVCGVAAPALSRLLGDGAAKASLWRELQAKVLPAL